MSRYKELEMSVHEALYNNISLLTKQYPATKELFAALKPDMFVKTNSSTFQHVIYYLFNIINPQLTKKTISNWPLFEIQQERIFRKEVTAMISVVRNKYPHANLPNVMISQIVSPSGLIITKLMLKLSQLAMFEHLKKKLPSDELLRPIKPYKSDAVTKQCIVDLQNKTAFIESSTEEKWAQFLQFYNEAVEASEVIITESEQVEQDLNIAKKQIEDIKITEGASQSQDSLNSRIGEMNEKMRSLESLRELCDDSMQLLGCLKSGDSILEFNKNEFVVPESIKHLFNVESKLDLHQLFTGLGILLQREALELPTFRQDQMTELHQFLKLMVAEYMDSDKKISNKLNKLNNLMELSNALN